MSHPVFRHIAILMLTLLLFACGESRHEALFADIEERISENADSAYTYVETLAADDSLTADMSAHDRARLSLLRIKAADKAYVPHRSDSLIKHGVLDYYEQHTRAKEYPEALYYAGRVYSDLGDSPTALKYYQKAMDARAKLKEGYKPIDSKLSSQTGQLLNKMHIYGEAEKYMRKAVCINQLRNDTANIVKNMLVLGAINLHIDSLECADSVFQQALKLCETSSNEQAQLEAYRAGVQYRMKNYAEARKLILGVPARVEPKFRSNAMAYAAQIFLKTGDNDSALYYARSILKMNDTRNHAVAYEVLIDPHIRELLSYNELNDYTTNFAQWATNNIANSDQEAVAIQNAHYNYTLQIKEKEEERKKKVRLTVVGLILTLIILLLCILLLFLRLQSKRRMINVLKLENCVDRLRGMLNSVHFYLGNKQHIQSVETQVEESSDQWKGAEKLKCSIESEAESRELLRKELLELVRNLPDSRNFIRNYVLPEDIKQSEAYRQLKQHLIMQTRISDKSDLWEKIETAVESKWPGFKDNLNLLKGSPLSDMEYHLSLLVKLTVRPAELCVLFSLEKGSISKRRSGLCESLLGEKVSSTALDIIIYSL